MINNLIYQAKVIRTMFVSDEKYLTKRFINKLGYTPNFNQPESFNKKVTARMIFERSALHTKLADKFAVRELVIDRIGEEYMVPLIGTYCDFNDINFDQFPNRFVLKCTHDSGSATICHDKDSFDFNRTEIKLKNSLKMNMYYRKREWHYKNISPLILAEHYVDLYRDAETLATITTCRVHCFEGQPMYVEVDVRGHDGTEYSNIYDTSWSLQPFTVDLKENTPQPVIEPCRMKKMMELSEKLCLEYGYSRIDFLLSQDAILFSEITLTPNAGRMVISPAEWDIKLGALWRS